MANILFFRGLNTYGDDHLHLGPLTLGLAHKYLQPKFESLGHNFIPVRDLKNGRVAEQALRAKEFIESLPQWKNGERFCMLGHSTGGLVARATLHLLDSPRDKVPQLLTMATPHRGAKMAEVAWDFDKRHPLTHKTCKKVGYDILKRLESYLDLRPDQTEIFNQKYEDVSTVRYSSMVFRIPYSKMSLPLMMINSRGQSQFRNIPNDGMVEASSQSWGTTIAEMELDHLSQLGFNFYVRPKHRKIVQDQFHRLCALVSDHFT